MPAPADERAFAAWNDHSSQARVDTELAILKFLREFYPDRHVTRVSPYTVDLRGFAKAGHATQTDQIDQHTDVTRVYKPPKLRLDKDLGKLSDKIGFGRFQYQWQEHEFLVYEVDYYEKGGAGRTHVFFVLAPAGDGAGATDFHHAATEALLLAAGKWTVALHKEIYVFDDAYWRKDKELYKSIQAASWDDVVLDPTMKENLINDAHGFFDSQALYKSFNVAWKRGIILHGLPGNGKTMSIKAIVKELSVRPEPVPSLYVKSFHSCRGPKWSVRSIFQKAREMSPCLLIFEDLDSLVESKIRSYFLNEVDGLESNEGILMIGSTNHLDTLDPAIAKRPSRFDRKYHFKLPDEKERFAYCRHWAQKFTASGMVEFPDEVASIISVLTEGFSFAYLKELFITSLLTLARGGHLAEETDIQPEQLDSDASSTVVVEHVDTEDGASEKKEVGKDDANKEAPEKDAKPSKGTKTDKTEKPAKPKKPKRVLPTVDIPEALQDNQLLRIVRAHSKELLAEMDNTDEEDKKKKKDSRREIRLPSFSSDVDSDEDDE